jgi:adenosine deaminase
MTLGRGLRTLRFVSSLARVSSLLAVSTLPVVSTLLAVSSLLALGFAGGAVAGAQTRANAEERTVRAFEAAKKLGPGGVYAFLQSFPKGADLHVHLGSGTSYAETLIDEAVEDGLCYSSAKTMFVKPGNAKAGAAGQPECGEGTVPVAQALKDQPLYDAIVDAVSMRSFVATPGFSGHDQFFATFDRVGALSRSHAGEWLDEAATRAAAQNEQYLELMVTPPFSHAAAAGYRIGWPAGAEKEISTAQLATLRTALLDGGLRDDIALDRESYNTMEASRSAREGCATTKPGPGCGIRVLYLYQVLRGYPPQQVFAQTLLGFELAMVDPRVVGINFVMPEDGYISMRDYHLQMQMVDYLHSVYPKVKITLHAGELAPGLVTPEGMSFHIREAIDLGHAMRIGHGIDVLYERDAASLLKEMAKKHIMVEINLTSNDGILGIKGAAHPLAAYRAAHVPWALSTDDEGVSRIDLTHEYAKGVEEQGLTYADLKQSARASLEHSFLPGADLWVAMDEFTHRVPPCAAVIGVGDTPSAACAKFLADSPRAAEEWELEHRLAVFEAGT